MKYSVGGGGDDFKRVPPGTHLAVCNMVADIGVQPGSGMYPDPKRKVVIRWEVPAERVEYKLADGTQKEGPLTVIDRLTASMNKKATFRKMLEAWRGRPFTDEEAGEFESRDILGQAGIITLTEKEVGDKTYTNIVGVSPLMKGMEKPKAENPLLYYGDDDKRQFNDLPKWVQEKINNQLAEPESEEDLDDRRAAEMQPFIDDDIPFN